MFLNLIVDEDGRSQFGQLILYFDVLREPFLLVEGRQGIFDGGVKIRIQQPFVLLPRGGCVGMVTLLKHQTRFGQVSRDIDGHDMRAGFLRAGVLYDAQPRRRNDFDRDANFSHIGLEEQSELLLVGHLGNPVDRKRILVDFIGVLALGQFFTRFVQVPREYKDGRAMPSQGSGHRPKHLLGTRPLQSNGGVVVEGIGYRSPAVHVVGGWEAIIDHIVKRGHAWERCHVDTFDRVQRL